MKKYLIALIAILLISFSLPALDSSFDIGVNLTYDSDGSNGTNEDDLLSKVALGLEMRMNISNFQMSIAGELYAPEAQSLLFSGIFGVGLSVDLFKYFKLGISTGPKVSYFFSDSIQEVDDDGDAVSNSNFLDSLWNGEFHYRVMLDILAGPVLSLGVAYTLPTSFSMAQADIAEIIPTRAQVKDGQLSVCIIMKVF